MKIKVAVPAMAAAFVLGVSMLGFSTDYGTSTSTASTSGSSGSFGSPGVSTGTTSGTSGSSSASSAAITGTVQSVDTANNIIQLKDPNGVIQKVKLDANSQISRGGNSVSLQDLKDGDMVSVQNPSSSM